MINSANGVYLGTTGASAVFLGTEKVWPSLPTSGGFLTEVAGYRYHAFSASGTFEVLRGPIAVEYLIVAGGGGRGGVSPNADYAGGGGGGLLQGSTTLGTNSYPVVIGAGGAAGLNSPGSPGQNGGNSSFIGITAVGGGGGGCLAAGLSGGSGGGGATIAYCNPYTSAPCANHPAGNGTAGQGYAGSQGIKRESWPGVWESYGGSGGGAGGAPPPASTVDGRRIYGGPGVIWNNVTWAMLGWSNLAIVYKFAPGGGGGNGRAGGGSIDGGYVQYGNGYGGAAPGGVGAGGSGSVWIRYPIS